MRTTVLVPLHASGAWEEVVAGNLTRLTGHADLVVSDATGVDDTLDRLRRRFGERPGIAWLGPRPLRSGWVAHCNDLLARTRTELVTWLPHDDEVDADWVRLGEQALDAHPDAVLALGRLRSVDRPGAAPLAYDPHPPFQGSDPVDRMLAALEVALRGDASPLGAAFRGVFRPDRAVPLPDTDAAGSWADVLWAVEMLTLGPFAPTDAVYRKRWYAGNTHGTWRSARRDPAFRAELLPRALAGLPAQTRSRVLATAWAQDAARADVRLSAQRARIRRLRRKLRRARARAQRR